MSTRAISRLKRDYLELKRDPVPHITAEPLPNNIFEWHYVLCGPKNSPYEGGYYHGKLLFPSRFPLRPPSINMITPNGRFKTNQTLCLTLSNYHPENWKISMTVSTILNALLSFMLDDTYTMNGIKTSDDDKRQLALYSLRFNLRNAEFRELFPDTVATIKETLRLRQRNLEALRQRNQEALRERNTANTAVAADNQTGCRRILHNILSYLRTLCSCFWSCPDQD